MPVVCRGGVLGACDVLFRGGDFLAGVVFVINVHADRPGSY